MLHSNHQCRLLLEGTPHFSYYKILRKITPSLNCALLLSYFLDQSKTHPDTPLKLSYAEISDALGFSLKEFKKAKQQLVEEQIIKGERKGFPATVHYTVDFTLLEQKLTNLHIVPLVPTDTPSTLKNEQNQNINPVSTFGANCNSHIVPKGLTDKGEETVHIIKKQHINSVGTKGTNLDVQLVPKVPTTEGDTENKNKEFQSIKSVSTKGTNCKDEDIYIYNNIYKYIYRDLQNNGTEETPPFLTMETAMIEIWKKITECSPNENFPRTTKNDQRLMQFLQFYCKNSLSKWHAYCMLIASSKFLMGDKTKFKATLGWALYPSNWTKVWEGEYGIGDRQPRFRFTEISSPSTISPCTLKNEMAYILSQIDGLEEPEEAKNFRKHILDTGGQKLYSDLVKEAACTLESSNLLITLPSRYAVRQLAHEMEVARYLPNGKGMKLKDNVRFKSIILNYPSGADPLQITIFIDQKDIKRIQ